MPAARFTIAVLVCAAVAPASATISNLATWDLYQDASGATPAQSAAMTGSAATNLAQLNFIDDVDIPAAYDIGYSSANANTVAAATSGYYFDRTQDFTIAIEFELTLDTPNGFVGLGLGIGEDREGVNSAGVVFGVGTGGFNTASFGAAATTDNDAITKLLNAAVAPTGTYAGSLTVEYDYDPIGDDFTITVGAAGASASSTPLAPIGTATFTSAELPDWVGTDLVASFFLRSDNPLTYSNWTGQSAEADFFNFTVDGSPTQVPEPTSVALLGLGGLLAARSRR